ncbi:MAG TPA: FtsX-like permease family protein [Casimicrobiaceae bacterium]|nr:FtsX-like permease family protein [Casimicrobiaceae bacterium]
MADHGAIAASRAVLRGSLAQNRWRVALAVLALALGVALGFAVQLINGSAVEELARGVQTLSGAADLEVRGPRAGFDETLYPVLARLRGVAAASPVVEVEARIAGRDEPLRIVGIDVFRAAVVEPALVPLAADRLDVLRSDALFPTPAALRWLDAREGDVVRAQSGLADVALRVAGTLDASAAQRFAVMDIAGVQAAFGRVGRLSRIDLRLASGVDAAAFGEELRARLPPGVVASRPEASVTASAGLSRSYRVNLQVLALVALFTGGLLVFSTQALAVVRRRAQFALLRVLGLTRRRLTALIVVEGALVGACGSVLGLALGYALAGLALRAFGGDLGSGYFRGIVPRLHAEWDALAAFFALGVGAAMLGSLVPAIEASHAAPAQSLKAGDEERAFARLRTPWPGLAALALGAALTMLPSVDGLPLAGYGAIALLLIGTLMLLPRLAALALATLPLPRAPAPRLALAQLAGAPGQLTVSLAAVVASVSLVASMAIMVASFRDSLEAWLVRILPADVYVRAASAGDTAFLPADTQARMRALPGVARAEFLREQQLALDPARPRIVLVARAVDRDDPARSLALLEAPVRVAASAPPPAWVNEAAADLYGFKPGQIVELPLDGRAVPFTVAGVWRDYGRPQGAIAIERDRYAELTGDTTVTNGALWLEAGADRAAVVAALRAIPGGDRLDIYSPGDIRALSLRAFDRTFAVTYALELAAVVIGLVGLSSSFGALVLARRREFGVLRHLGMTRRQVAAMLATEGAVASGIGLAVGLALGFAMSLILIHVVNRQSFHWGMELSVPWAALGAFAMALLALSTLTALASGRQAMSADVVGAVKEDW